MTPPTEQVGSRPLAAVTVPSFQVAPRHCSLPRFRRMRYHTFSCDLCRLLPIPSALPPPLFFHIYAVISSPRKHVAGMMRWWQRKQPTVSSFKRLWFPQVRGCREDQRMNKPENSRFGKPKFQAFYCLSAVGTWAMKIPHQQIKDALHENQAEKGNLSGSHASLPAPTHDLSCDSWRWAKRRTTGRLSGHMPSCWKGEEKNSVKAI